MSLGWKKLEKTHYAVGLLPKETEDRRGDGEEAWQRAVAGQAGGSPEPKLDFVPGSALTRPVSSLALGGAEQAQKGHGSPPVLIPPLLRRCERLDPTQPLAA